MRLRRFEVLGFLVAPMVLSGGCTTAASVGVKLVGAAVDHVDVEKRQKELLGREPAAADEMFGEPVDTFRDVNGKREWVVYPVKPDPLDRLRYVVEVADGKVVSLTKAKKYADPKIDIPRALIYKHKCGGKSPAACEEALDLGKPLVTVRSEKTGRLIQLYDADIIEVEGVTKPHYCLVRFDGADRCEKVELVEAAASTEAEPLSS